ncbi:hypothetical protein [Chryseobacterium shigense]|uniref:Microcystin-dependent protein n=1 Tax=Chryseobacterium shigense TaxID=297244 RepID=A0A841NBW1_9FLAO|nr:hypothetical protein [Chryseobacterium shigense]MBB6372513.1 hypothetical protein [Chryseobacterium shigense]
MRKILISNVLLILLSYPTINANAQVKISNSSGVINTDSVLHLENSANNKGFLLTRLALQATNAAAPLSSHVAGMIVFNTATAGTAPNNVTPGLYYNNGSQWVKMTTKSPQPGDIKNGFQSADHNGWYLLNGRAVSTLAVNPRARATALGFAANLPDASDRYLKSTSGADTPGTSAGANSFTLAQTNLPNFTFSGSTNTTGSHTHTYTDNPQNTAANGVVSGTNNPVSNTASIDTNTDNAGAHTHTLSFSLGGTSQPVNLIPNNIITNVFIYLGN